MQVACGNCVQDGLMVYSPINAIINGNFNIKLKINRGHSRGHQPLFGEENLIGWGRDIYSLDLLLLFVSVEMLIRLTCRFVIIVCFC